MKIAKVFLIFTILMAYMLFYIHKNPKVQAHISESKSQTVIPVSLNDRQTEIPDSLNHQMVKRSLTVKPVLLYRQMLNRNQQGIPVLLYHQILKSSENQQKTNPAVINLEAFEAQMKYLHDNGYYTATLDDLAAYLKGGKTLPPKTVVITFDDGLKTNYLYAYPILKKYGFKATEFLILNRITDKPVNFNPKRLEFLSWPEINAMKDVFQFASHTKALHGLVDGKPALLAESKDVVLQDLIYCRKVLATDDFAYPFGAYNASTIELLKEAGYQHAFTTFPKNAQIGDNPFEIGRIPVGPNITLTKFENMLNGGHAKMGTRAWLTGRNPSLKRVGNT